MNVQQKKITAFLLVAIIILTMLVCVSCGDENLNYVQATAEQRLAFKEKMQKATECFSSFNYKITRSYLKTDNGHRSVIQNQEVLLEKCTFNNYRLTSGQCRYMSHYNDAYDNEWFFCDNNIVEIYLEYYYLSTITKVQYDQKRQYGCFCLDDDDLPTYWYSTLFFERNLYPFDLLSIDDNRLEENLCVNEKNENKYRFKIKGYMYADPAYNDYAMLYITFNKDGSIKGKIDYDRTSQYDFAGWQESQRIKITSKISVTNETVQEPKNSELFKVQQ